MSSPFVIVGLSGGVDSSVSAALLKQQGYRVEGLFMKNWEEDDGTEYCTAMADLADAQSVCDRLDIPLHTVNFAAEYWDRVFEHFLAEYGAGRTPNPDILCNKEIKFRAFLDYALRLGADAIATGHYARTAQQGTLTRLLRGEDRNKDQSYFLHAVSGDRLARTLFPVGHLPKPEVRQLAAALGLSTATKKDSTGICFIGERRFRDFLQQYLPARPGNIVDTNGTVLGQHDGLMYYTLGQRGGIGLGGIKNRPEAPWFVLYKDVPENRLVIGQGHDHPLLFGREVYFDRPDWVNPLEIAANGLQLTAMTRYRQPDQPGTLYTGEYGYRMVFDQPQRAVTPGQSIVFYQNDVCLGGGVITGTDAPVPQFLHHSGSLSH